MDTFDYVIVGAGSAGCVLTNRLSEDAGTSICVVEAGPSDWHPYIHLPAGFIKTFHMKSVNWGYSQEPGPWTGGRSIYAPRGKTLGGSSSINGHIYNRGQRQDFNTWAQLGNRGWGYPDVLAYFKRQGRLARRGARQQGSHPLRRYLQLTAGAAIVRRRFAGIAAIARHRGAPRAARRWRGPAGSLRAAFGRARQEHPDHQ